MVWGFCILVDLHPTLVPITMGGFVSTALAQEAANQITQHLPIGAGWELIVFPMG
jgi:hypothetical protein